MPSQKPRTEIYKNATVVHLENRKLSVVRDAEHTGYDIVFFLRSDDISPRSLHRTYKNKVVQTVISLSTEAAMALCDALQIQISNDIKRDII